MHSELENCWKLKLIVKYEKDGLAVDLNFDLNESAPKMPVHSQDELNSQSASRARKLFEAQVTCKILVFDRSADLKWVGSSGGGEFKVS